MNNEQSLIYMRWECKYHLTWLAKFRRKQIFEDGITNTRKVRG